MFGLYTAKDQRVERRVLCFGPASDELESMAGGLGDTMEIKVFRAKGRKRIVPEVERFDIGASSRKQGGRKGGPHDSVEGGGIRSSFHSLRFAVKRHTLTQR